MTRRDLLRYLLATTLAATVDLEHLLWTPKPIITVPALPRLAFHKDAFAMAMEPIETTGWARPYRDGDLEVGDVFTIGKSPQ